PWRIKDLYFIDDPNSLGSAHSFWASADDANVAIRVEAHAYSSVRKANHKLKELLSRFQLPDIKRQQHPEFGDVLYTVPRNFVIVFLRREFAFRLRNVGKNVV